MRTLGRLGRMAPSGPARSDSSSTHLKFVSPLGYRPPHEFEAVYAQQQHLFCPVAVLIDLRRSSDTANCEGGKLEYLHCVFQGKAYDIANF